MSDTSQNLPIAIEGLRKSFGNQVVLDGIDLTVKHGETLAVLGQSGTGKSVMLKLIIGLEQADLVVAFIRVVRLGLVDVPDQQSRSRQLLVVARLLTILDQEVL